MTTYITPNTHEKSEWSRMAQAAYRNALNSIGHTYSTAASLPNAGRIPVEYFDKLQSGYRGWLLSGYFVDQSGRLHPGLEVS